MKTYGREPVQANDSDKLCLRMLLRKARKVWERERDRDWGGRGKWYLDNARESRRACEFDGDFVAFLQLVARFGLAEDGDGFECFCVRGQGGEVEELRVCVRTGDLEAPGM